MKPIDRDKLFSIIARKLELPFDKVKEAVSFQFKFVKLMMEDGDLEAEKFHQIRLRYFGTFKVDKRRIKHIKNNIRNSQKEKDDHEEFERKGRTRSDKAKERRRRVKES